MKKIYFLILMTFFIISCGEDETDKNQVSSQTLVFGRKNLVSLSFGKEWSVFPSEILELQLTGRDRHQIEFNTVKPDKGFDKATDNILNRYRKNKGFIIISKSEIEVDTIPSLFVDFEYVEYNEKTKVNFFFIPLKERLLFIKTWAPESHFDEDYIEDLLDTLTITDKKGAPKTKPTKRPFFFPEKILGKISEFGKKDYLSEAVILKMHRTLDTLILLDKEFKKTKDFSVFSKTKSFEVKRILKANGFKNLKDYEKRLNKSIAGLMVINYTSEADNKISSVEMNLIKQIISRNSLTLNDIRVVYENYSNILELEKKMRL